MGATADRRGTVIGEPVTGTVQNPDRDITVTLAPASKRAPAEGSNSSGDDVTACAYDDAPPARPTDGLATGLYRVEVTDATFEGEGTKLVTVALSDDPGYEPQVHDRPEDEASTARRAVVELTGWRPGSTVTLFQRGGPGRTIRVARVPIDDKGAGRVVVKRLGSPAAVLATDGVWDDRRVDGWNQVYVNAL